MTVAQKTQEPRLYHFLSTTEVQHFLNNIGGRPFTVIFMKKNGEQRKITGVLDTSVHERKKDVPVMVEMEVPYETETGEVEHKWGVGWKSFNIGRVLWIQGV
jgi:hypothetical protein